VLLDVASGTHGLFAVNKDTNLKIDAMLCSYLFQPLQSYRSLRPAGFLFLTGLFLCNKRRLKGIAPAELPGSENQSRCNS
jgi:hypothetical protein